jgi:hypothetical protein
VLSQRGRRAFPVAVGGEHGAIVIDAAQSEVTPPG